MQLTNEELDKIVEEAVDNNVIYYSDEKSLLIRNVLAGLFSLCPQDIFYANNKTVGIQYIISNDFPEFDNEGITEDVITRILISNEQKDRILDTFQKAGALWPGNYDDSPYKEWFFIFKTSWGKHYFGAIRQKRKTE